MPRPSIFVVGIAFALMATACGGGNGGDLPGRAAEKRPETPATSESGLDIELDATSQDERQDSAEAAPEDDPEGSTSGTTEPQDSIDASPSASPGAPSADQQGTSQPTVEATPEPPEDDPEGATSGTPSADQEGTSQSTAEATSEPPEETVEPPPLADPVDPSLPEPSEEAAAHPEELDQTQSNGADTSCSPAALELLGLSEGAVCGSALDLPSQPPEESLVRAIAETLEDAYVTKGTARQDAIWWGDDSYDDWSHIYEAVGRAADAMQIQPVPTIDGSGEWCWLDVMRGGFVFADENADRCLPVRPPVPEQQLELLVPVINGTEPYRRTIQLWNGGSEVIYGAYQKFRWRDDRWKLDWRYWCLTIGEAQGENGVRLFEMTGEDEFDVAFRCEE